MEPLRSLLERLGAAGAARNAALAAAVRDDEDRLVEALTQRLGTLPQGVARVA